MVSDFGLSHWILTGDRLIFLVRPDGQLGRSVCKDPDAKCDGEGAFLRNK